MNDLVFRRAVASDVDAIVRLVQLRIDWMNLCGLHQWNETDYFGRYPREYWLRNIGYFCVGTLEGRVVVAVALYDNDVRWAQVGVLDDGVVPEGVVRAWYLHHLVSDPKVKGAGIDMMRHVEALALAQGIEVLRLDSAVGNEGLERMYTLLGYAECGRCQDRLYHGVLREKWVAERR